MFWTNGTDYFVLRVILSFRPPFPREFGALPAFFVQTLVLHGEVSRHFTERERPPLPRWRRRRSLARCRGAATEEAAPLHLLVASSAAGRVTGRGIAPPATLRILALARAPIPSFLREVRGRFRGRRRLTERVLRIRPLRTRRPPGRGRS